MHEQNTREPAPETTGAGSPVSSESSSEEAQAHPSGASRRQLFGMLGAGAAGLALGGLGGATIAGAVAGGGSTPANSVVPFYGEHQAGITTPAQDRLHFASFTMNAGASRDDLISLLKDWTAAAERLSRGEEVGDGIEPSNALLPPDDTGEATGLGAGNLSITFGFGRSLFVGADGNSNPYGIRAQLPRDFEELPKFAFDLLDATKSGGDLCVQACADDPQIAVHAIRNLARIAAGRAHLAWSQLGFGRTSSTSRSQDTPRNLFGFKDGTANVMAEESDALAEHIWVGKEAPGWLQGGTYLVARKIQMTIENWDRSNLAEQEKVFGRTKREGAPLTSAREFDTPDFEATAPGGDPVIDVAAHVRLAHPTQNGGVRLLRRGYNYVEGSNPLGQLEGGLFFISFQRSPADFVQVQRALQPDLLNEYIRHIASGLWAVPRGMQRGEYIGQALFA